jgi:hypothetical protein
VNPLAEARSYDESVPIGVILPWLPRLFSGPGNTGIDTTDRITLPWNYIFCDGQDISTAVPDSPLINGAYTRVADLTDNRFLMGGVSTIGYLGDIDIVYGGANHAGPPTGHSNNADNSLTIDITALPVHNHEPGSLGWPGGQTGGQSAQHGHLYQITSNCGGGFGLTGSSSFQNIVQVSQSLATTGGFDTDHSHSYYVPNGAMNGATGDGAGYGLASAAINVLPKYLLVKFIVRVK